MNRQSSERGFPLTAERQAWMALAVFCLVGLLIFWSLPAGAVSGVEEDFPDAETFGPPVPLEIELKLLRAEMAAVDEDWETVRPLLEALREPLQGTHLMRRWEVVHQLLMEAEGRVTPTIRLRMSWPFDLKGRYVVMLPVSGPYAPASEALLAALKRHPDFNPLAVLDTAALSVEALQQTVALYEPDWILGPLQPKVLSAWLKTGSAWPLLSFAPVRENCLYCYSITTDAQQQLALQKPLLDDGVRNWLVTDAALFKSERTDQLPSRVLTTLVKQRIDVAVRHALSVPASEARTKWLKKTLGSGVPRLHAVPRVRQDLERVVVVLPEAQAYQVRTLLEYWQLARPVYWLPKPLPDRATVRRVMREWPETIAFLPPFLLDDQYPSDRLGIFHALGDTVRVVLDAGERALQSGVETPMGTARLDQYKGLTVRYPRVRIHNGGARRMAVSSEMD